MITAALPVAAGLLTGQAIRLGMHGDGDWPVLAALAAAAWASLLLSLWLPYRAAVRPMKRRRAFLLRIRDTRKGRAL